MYQHMLARWWIGTTGRLPPMRTMKVQWQLIDINTRKVVATLGEIFDLDELLFREEFEKQYYGTGSGNPIGILKGAAKSNSMDVGRR